MTVESHTITMYHMPSDALMSLRLPREVMEAAERAAKAEDRSRSNWCLRAIREKLTTEGYLSEPTRKASKASRKAS